MITNNIFISSAVTNRSKFKYIIFNPVGGGDHLILTSILIFWLSRSSYFNFILNFIYHIGRETVQNKQTNKLNNDMTVILTKCDRYMLVQKNAKKGLAA